MKNGEKALFVFSALLVLAWPVFAFTSIFAFDAPIRSGFDESSRYAFVVAVLSYPLAFSAPFILRRGIDCRKKNSTEHSCSHHRGCTSSLCSRAVRSSKGYFPDDTQPNK